RQFLNITDHPRCMAWSPDGKQIAVGHFSGNFLSGTGVVRIWDFATGKEVRSMPGHTAAITSVSWTKDGKRLASSSFDKTARVWDPATGKELVRITASTQACDHLAFTPDGKRLVTTGWGTDHAVRLWEVEGARELARFDGHTANVIAVAVTPDG